LIPAAYLQAWSAKAPWPESRQVEQDLIICRALCDLFNSPKLAGKIAFRGGTAINKLLFKKPLRYSEDIDLVQITAEPIGPVVDGIREALAWLGKCARDQAGHSMHLIFRFAPEVDPSSTMKLKVEINTREHHSLLGIRHYSFAVENDWYQGATQIASYEPEELFGTKLRALLQRRKNRDLLDLHEGMQSDCMF
jgi:predicted nucleotidyltransferase component of viral defense system